MTGHIGKLKATAATCRVEVGLEVGAVRSLEGRIARGENSVNTAEAGTRKTLNKMSELQELVEGLNQTVCGKRVKDAQLVYVELIHVRMGNNAVSLDSEGTAGEAKCKVRDGFASGVFPDALGPSDSGLSDHS